MIFISIIFITLYYIHFITLTIKGCGPVRWVFRPLDIGNDIYIFWKTNIYPLPQNMFQIERTFYIATMDSIHYAPHGDWNTVFCLKKLISVNILLCNIYYRLIHRHKMINGYILTQLKYSGYIMGIILHHIFRHKFPTSELWYLIPLLGSYQDLLTRILFAGLKKC